MNTIITVTAGRVRVYRYYSEHAHDKPFMLGAGDSTVLDDTFGTRILALEQGTSWEAGVTDAEVTRP